MTKIIDNEKGSVYDPYKSAPLSKQERIYFNVSAVYITLVSAFIFALLMVGMPSFFSAFLGLVWAMPGLLVLWGFHSGRNVKKVRRFHTSVFLAEILFLIYTIYFIAIACMREDYVAATIDVIMYILYVMSLEFGLLRLVKKHEIAYYEERLKGDFQSFRKDVK